MNLDSISQELDRLYEFEISEYIARCDELKKQGFKIYRNSTGQHKVVMTGQGTSSAQRHTVYDPAGERKESFFSKAKKKVKRGVENTKTVINFIKVLHNAQKNNNNRRY